MEEGEVGGAFKGRLVPKPCHGEGHFHKTGFSEPIFPLGVTDTISFCVTLERNLLPLLLKDLSDSHTKMKELK